MNDNANLVRARSDWRIAQRPPGAQRAPGHRAAPECAVRGCGHGAERAVGRERDRDRQTDRLSACATKGRLGAALSRTPPPPPCRCFARTGYAALQTRAQVQNMELLLVRVETTRKSVAQKDMEIHKLRMDQVRSRRSMPAARRATSPALLYRGSGAAH